MIPPEPTPPLHPWPGKVIVLGRHQEYDVEASGAEIILRIEKSRYSDEMTAKLFEATPALLGACREMMHWYSRVSALVEEVVSKAEGRG